MADLEVAAAAFLADCCLVVGGLPPLPRLGDLDVDDGDFFGAVDIRAVARLLFLLSFFNAGIFMI